jgi:hypothetical protein
LSAQSNALENGQLDPLFASDDLFELTIEAPFTSIMRDRSIEEETPAKLRYSDSDNNIIEHEIGIRARGGYRRDPDVCNFAPLRLNFKKSQTPNTLFDHQDKLKLITHCQTNSPKYEQHVIAEYLAYRILNLVTDLSFRPRLVRVTYFDTVHEDRTIVRLAMISEHRDRLAKRISSEAISTEIIKYNQLENAYTNIISVFHYFIGNTDYSPIAPAPGDDCCHNHALFAGERKRYVSIPFDFDMSGFVYAEHAISNPRFKLRDVRQRRYRGRCFNNFYVATSVEKFFEQRDSIYALIKSQELLTDATRGRLTKYAGDFFESLDSPEKIKKTLVGNCT